MAQQARDTSMITAVDMTMIIKSRRLEARTTNGLPVLRTGMNRRGSTYPEHVHGLAEQV